MAAGAAVAGVCIGLGVGLHYLFSSPAAAPASIPAPTSAGLAGQATWAARARPAPPITTLRDQTGARFALSSLRGRTVAMVFFDSFCRQACPLEGRALAVAERSLPAAQRPVLVVVSVNPHDTPGSTRGAARRWGLAQTGAWHWLRGSQAALARVWKAYRIFVAPPRGGDIGHTEALYLIDRHGDERSGYLYPFLPGFVTHDLHSLALADAGKGAS
ncbi:MAG: SCO family protein [Actinomycetota bacterium]|nr:SCO family protein [Actinomycetota bacterium]